MNNNFDELILKRRTRGRVRTASMGVHRRRARLVGREQEARTPRGACTAEGAHGEAARTCVGSRATKGNHGNGAYPAEGRVRTRLPLEARTGRAWRRAMWLAGAQTYVPSNGGAHVSNEEGINGVTLLI
jgi:hypothetical protein